MALVHDIIEILYKTQHENNLKPARLVSIDQEIIEVGCLAGRSTFKQIRGIQKFDNLIARQRLTFTEIAMRLCGE